MLNIRWHGRGGQGTKTAVLLLAESVIMGGSYAQGFSEYGPERMGAPVIGFNRIDSKPIRLHCPIGEPHVVVILDESLLETVAVAAGLRAGGTVLVNTTGNPHDIRARLSLPDGSVYTVDATGIALETIGRPIPNTVMIGALIHLTNVMTCEAFEQSFAQKFAHLYARPLLESNAKAVRRAFTEVKGAS